MVLWIENLQEEQAAEKHEAINVAAHITILPTEDTSIATSKPDQGTEHPDGWRYRKRGL